MVEPNEAWLPQNEKHRERRSSRTGDGRRKIGERERGRRGIEAREWWMRVRRCSRRRQSSCGGLSAVNATATMLMRKKQNNGGGGFRSETVELTAGSFPVGYPTASTGEGSGRRGSPRPSYRRGSQWEKKRKMVVAGRSGGGTATTRVDCRDGGGTARRGQDGRRCGERYWGAELVTPRACSPGRGTRNRGGEGEADRWASCGRESSFSFPDLDFGI